MLPPLIPDISHQTWIIAKNILGFIDSKRARKVAGRLKISEIDDFIIVIKVLMMASLFERDITNIVSEINSNPKFKRFLRIKSEVNAQKIYKIHSNLDFKVLCDFLNRSLCVSKRTRNKKRQVVIIDATSITIDLNTWRNRFRIGKTNKKYKYSFSNSIGYYVGFKLILAMDLNYNLIGFKVYENCPNDAKILVPFVEELYKSRRIKSGDIIICDRGFPSEKNYNVLINRFLLIPAIYPRKNTNIKKIINNDTPPLDVFTYKYKFTKWKSIREEFKKLMSHWGHFRFIRYRIEIFFNIAKNTLSLKKNHQYTQISIEKKVARAVFLTTAVISMFDLRNIDLRTIPSR
jgi:Transposase DDE domain.